MTHRGPFQPLLFCDSVSLSKGMNSSSHCVCTEAWNVSWTLVVIHTSQCENNEGCETCNENGDATKVGEWVATSVPRPGLWRCIHHIHGIWEENPRHVSPPKCSGAPVCELSSLWEAPTSLSVDVPPAAAESPNNRETRGKGIKWWLSRCRVLLTLFVSNDHESKRGEKKTHKWKHNWGAKMSLKEHYGLDYDASGPTGGICSQEWASD